MKLSASHVYLCKTYARRVVELAHPNSVFELSTVLSMVNDVLQYDSLHT